MSRLVLPEVIHNPSLTLGFACLVCSGSIHPATLREGISTKWSTELRGEEAFMGAEGTIYAQFAFDESLSGRLWTLFPLVSTSLYMFTAGVSLSLLHKDTFMLRDGDS